MDNEKKVERSAEKRPTRKKIVKITIAFSVVLIVGFIVICALPFLWFVGVVLYNMFLDIPSKPKVEHGEFSFELVYEYKGERVTIADTIVCDYDGYSFSLEGGNSRDWTCSFKNNENYGQYYIDQENEPDLYILVPDAPDYYMGDKEYNKDDAAPYIVYVDEETGTYYEEKDKIDAADIEIIEWNPSDPLKNNFQ